MKLTYLFVIAGLLAPGAVSAITIDDFSTASDAVFDSDFTFVTPGASAGSQTQTLASGIVRTISFDDGQPAPAGFDNTGILDDPVDGNRWTFNTNVSGATATLAYAFGGGIDLSSKTAFRFGTVNNAEAGETFSVNATVGDILGATASTILTFDETDEGSALTASFTVFSGIDFAQVSSLALALSGTGPAPDASISASIAAIPVPAALPLLAGGVVALTAVARRKKAAPEA